MQLKLEKAEGCNPAMNPEHHPASEKAATRAEDALVPFVAVEVPPRALDGADSRRDAAVHFRGLSLVDRDHHLAVPNRCCQDAGIPRTRPGVPPKLRCRHHYRSHNNR